MTTLNKLQLHAAARYMANGRMGSFAGHIGDAYLIADSKNAAILADAFGNLFIRAYEMHNIGA